MKKLSLIVGMITTMSIMPLTWANAQIEETIQCEYLSGYGDATFYLGYIFNFQTNYFQKLNPHAVGPLVKISESKYTFVDNLGSGAFQLKKGYALLTHSKLDNPVPYLMKCKSIYSNLQNN